MSRSRTMGILIELAPPAEQRMLAHIGDVEQALQPVAASTAGERLRQTLAPLAARGTGG